MNREQLVRLEAWPPFESPEPLPEIKPAPMLSQGYVTFGSFNHPNKIGADVIALWARILHALPDSRLLIRPVTKTSQRRRLLAAFAAQGIEAQRLTLLDKMPYQEYLELHNQVDILLASFPYSGAVTTREGLCMGVPTLVMQGDLTHTRLGVQLMHLAGLQDYLADDKQAYLDKALELVQQLPSLSRPEIRRRFINSPIFDSVAATRELEQNYRRFWRRYCKLEDYSI